ncbi:hypothetical protein LR48_Vigan05g102300 [Vigna angularis]|uniref:Putative plant transposon protein domain-containing protein n=1 Tax=Phaseolus angularis TaxID=3914 RepID=A0A0L9ULJ2_PHAAN|nr:hypothetical protein LR48_Vigan05g102300 [Vigna angularis]
MASSSSSSRRKERVALVTRNTNPSGWMKVDCYLNLVEVFYTNLRVLNGVIHSRVKGVNITIDDNVWSNIVGLKAKGLDSHIRDSDSNKWLTKRAIYRKCLRYPGRYKVDKQYLHDGLNKEEKITVYVLTWLLLPRTFVEDKMSTEDVFLLNAIKTRIPTNWVAMKVDCYLNLVEVFYTNLRVLNGVIHSRVKGVNITIDDNVWSNIVGLKAKGLDSHIRDSDSNKWLTKRAIYRKCLRYPGRYKVDKQYLHDGLNKEEKITVYVLTWLLLPRTFVEDKMSTEDVFLLNAIKTRIPTNWVAVLKDHMIGAGDKYAHKLPYRVFISKVLVLQGVDVSEEDILLFNRSQEIGIPSMFSIGLESTMNGWFFTDEQTVGSSPTRDEDHTTFIPQTDFEKYVVDQFRKTSERDELVEKTLFKLEKKGDVLNENCIGSETEDSDDEDSMESS